jgi:hypothetical protein
MINQNQFPSGWDQQRVQKIITTYETQTEDEAMAEDESAWETSDQTVMWVPTDLVTMVRELIANHQVQQ